METTKEAQAFEDMRRCLGNLHHAEDLVLGLKGGLREADRKAAAALAEAIRGAITRATRLKKAVRSHAEARHG